MTGASARLALRTLQVRLRFIIVLAVAGLVIGQWETLRNYGDKAMRALRGTEPASESVSSDTEYFCPMDPGVVSDWPGKCGICNMGLVRRKKGESAPLPSGVVARMQISPYRLQLAGIQTAPAAYRPLHREIRLVGNAVADDPGPTAEVELFEGDRPFVAEGQAAEVMSDEWEGRPALAAKVRRILPGDPNRQARVRLELDDSDRGMRPGMAVTVTLRRPIADQEPFRSMPSRAPALREGDPIAIYLCPQHAEVLRTQRGKCPVDPRDALERHPLLANQRVGWWCPMHPKVVEDRPGAKCDECGGMTLVPRVVTYRPEGQVLTVPESAVVDTGTRTVVFVERMPGMFDGVEVVLGQRCGESYPVVSGLEPGERVATAGAFLIDAETRLNPSLAAGYFGAGRAGHPEVAPAGDHAVHPEPSSEDRALAAQQKICPVTGKPLGSMGTPVRVIVAGRAVLICCEGCEDRLRKSPEKYLSKLAKDAGDARKR